MEAPWKRKRCLAAREKHGGLTRILLPKQGTPRIVRTGPTQVCKVPPAVYNLAGHKAAEYEQPGHKTVLFENYSLFLVTAPPTWSSSPLTWGGRCEGVAKPPGCSCALDIGRMESVLMGAYWDPYVELPPLRAASSWACEQ